MAIEVKIPAEGAKISKKDGGLQVPDNPVIPYIEGDGIGPDIWRATVRVLDAAVTSTGSFASYNLQEQTKSYTSPTENTFWFMFEPLIISNEAFEELCPEQQEALVSVGEELQEFAYTASEEDDTRVEGVFEEAGVEVTTMDDAAFDEWQELAQKQWDAFAGKAPNGEELMGLAKEASAE